MAIITPTVKMPGVNRIKLEDQQAIGEGLNSETPVTPAYTAPAAPLDPTLDQYKTDVGFMQEQDFYDRYGLDPQRDLEDVNSMLDYEYQTAMANYGENAEQLYQMGLSGSGVSDIFQANAYSAYLGAKNDAYAAFIDAKKANKAKYQEYVSGINTGFNEYLNEYKNNRTQLENDAFSKAYDIYDGYNMEQVKQDLAALGFDQGIIDNVANRLSVLDTEGKKSQTVQKIVASILEVMPNYTGSAADQQFIRDMFGASVDANALEQAINIATSRYTTSEAGYADMVQKFLEQYKDTYDPATFADANSFISSMGVVTDPNAEGYDANRYNAAYEAFETIKAEYDAHKAGLEGVLNSLFYDEDGNFAYTGSADQKNYLEQYLASTNLSDADKQYIRDQLEARKIQKEEAYVEDTVTAITDVPVENVSYAGLEAEIKNSNNNADVINASSKKYSEAVLNALDNVDSLANAWSLVPGMTQNDWSNLDDTQRLEKVIDGIGQAKISNVLTSTAYNTIIEKWALSEIDSMEIKDMPALIEKLDTFTEKYKLSYDVINKVKESSNVHISKIEPTISQSGQGAIMLITGKGNIQLRVRPERMTDQTINNLVKIDHSASGDLYLDPTTNIKYYLYNGQYLEIESNEFTDFISIFQRNEKFTVHTGSSGYDPVKQEFVEEITLPNGTKYSVPQGYEIVTGDTGVIIAVPKGGATAEKQPIVLYDPNKK